MVDASIPKKMRKNGTATTESTQSIPQNRLRSTDVGARRVNKSREMGDRTATR